MSRDWTLTLAALAAGAVLAGAPAAGASRAPAPVYYVAMGGSLSTGTGATPGHGYVDDIMRAETPNYPGLTLEDLGCPGATTTTLRDGGGGCSYPGASSQLDAAEKFITAHPGQIAFVTIDVGGNDIDPCALGQSSINQKCVKKAFATVHTNLTAIVAGLRQAAGASVPIVGMRYYDPVLAAWVDGPPIFPPPAQGGQTMARQSVTMTEDFNTELTSIYQGQQAGVADGQAAFQTADWAKTGSWQGQTLPQNVADICNWTHMCQASNPNVHTNDTGHALLAKQFVKQIALLT